MSKGRIEKGDIVHIEAMDGTLHMFREVISMPVAVGDCLIVVNHTHKGDDLEYYQQFRSIKRYAGMNPEKEK